MPSTGFTVVSYGEVLWDLLPSGPVLGGAPFNFACRVASLGDRAVMVSRLGRDELGQKAMASISKLGVQTSCVQWDEAKPTGTVRVSLDAKGIPDYFIVPDVAYDFIEPTPQALTAVSEADCFCYGTIGWRSPVSHATLERLLAGFNGRHRLLDLNLRKDCWTAEGVRSLVSGAGILKCNDQELDIVAGLYGLPPGSIVERVETLISRTLLSLVVVTLGEAGSFAASRSGEKVYSQGFARRLVDTVGAGDAFTAGFLHVLLCGGPLSEACTFGNALGAIVVGQRGATQPTPLDDVERIMKTGRRIPADPRFKAV